MMQISAMAEEEFYSVFHLTTGQALELCVVTLAYDGTMLLGNCTDIQIKELFPSENLKELHISQLSKHGIVVQKTSQDKERKRDFSSTM